MRVISGTAKGKKLISLEGLETRPTLDRVKESIFDILQFSVKDSNVLDLFAGSGALAIEALSRGANSSVLCDNSYKAINIIKKNIENTKLTGKTEVINKDYLEAIVKLKKDFRKFDLLFLDPPYKSDYLIKSIKQILQNDLLSKKGIIIAETNDVDKINAIKNIDNLKIYDVRKYGIVYIIFIRKE